MYFYRLPEGSNVSINRLLGIFIQEFYITKRSLEVIVDLFFWALMTTVVYGFITLYLTRSAGITAIQYVFLGMLLWEVVRTAQYSISIGALWNIWSRNLSNMFISPLSLTEYLAAQMLAGLVKSVLVFILISAVANVLFGFNTLQVGIHNLALHLINLVVFAWWIGIVLLGIIFKYGTRIQALAWSVVFLFQPLSAAYFPLEVLPKPLQILATIFPTTHVFVAARINLQTQQVQWGLFTIAFVENIVYFALSLWFFHTMYNKSRDTGQFARNEG